MIAQALLSRVGMLSELAAAVIAALREDTGYTPAVACEGLLGNL